MQLSNPQSQSQGQNQTQTASKNEVIENSEKEILIDTCKFIHACSTVGDKERPNEGYSDIDQEVMSLNLSPKEIRKDIENLLMSNKLLVSEIVIQELKDFLLDSCKKLKQKNKNRLANLIQTIKGKVIEISVGTNEYNLQKEVFKQIETEAQKRIKSIEKNRNANLEGWEESNGHKNNCILKEVYSDPVCKTWRKIHSFKEAVLETANGIHKKPFLLNDFLIVLLAKKRKALIQTNDIDIKVLLAAYNEVLNNKKINAPHTPHTPYTPTQSPQMLTFTP